MPRVPSSDRPASLLTSFIAIHATCKPSVLSLSLSLSQNPPLCLFLLPQFSYQIPSFLPYSVTLAVLIPSLHVHATWCVFSVFLPFVPPCRAPQHFDSSITYCTPFRSLLHFLFIFFLKLPPCTLFFFFFFKFHVPYQSLFSYLIIESFRALPTVRYV